MALFKSNTLIKKVFTGNVKKGDVKSAVKDVKGQAKDLGQNIVKATKQAIDKVGDVGKIALLIPLVPIMNAALKAKGLKPEKDNEKLARQFYENIVKRHNYDSQTLGNNNVMVATEPVSRKKDVDPVTIGIVVSAIIEWIQNAQKKKAKNAKMTKAEKAAAKAADIVEEQAAAGIAARVNEVVGARVINFGAMLAKYWWVLTLLIVAAVAMKRGKI